MNMPNQKMTLPSVCWFFSHLVRLSATSYSSGRRVSMGIR